MWFQEEKMKKFLVCFAVLTAMVSMISCGGDNKSKNATGTLGGECYGNKSCNDGLICDEENNTCVEDPENPINDSDTSSEQTNNDSDTTPDNDNDTTDTSNSDNPSDSDTTSDDSSECKPNPCKEVQNSTGNCSTNFYTSIPTNFYDQYVCECKKGYVFDGASCIKNSSNLPLCNPESKTPCVDAETALIWSAKTPEKMEKVDAMDYCNNLNEGGYNDWRLPSYKVLGTLLVNCDPPYDSESDAPALYASCQGGSKSDGSYSKFGEVAFLWSTTYGGINFLNGGLDPYKEGDAYARCVRKDFSDSHEAKCLQGLPENANWVTDSVTQTWDWDNMWTPTTEGKYGSNNENENGCFFKCDSDYYYNGIDIYGKCVNPCIPNPCEKVEHSTKECIGDVDRKDYRCKCESNWESFEHICIPSSGINGLAWSSIKSSASWLDAISYCDNLSEGGYSEWHLPTISELRTLIQNCPAIETEGECGITDSCLSDECYKDSHCSCRTTIDDYGSGKYSKLGDDTILWSSSSFDNKVFCVDFKSSYITREYKDSKFSFRCVRSAD